MHRSNIGIQKINLHIPVTLMNDVLDRCIA